MTTHLNDEQLVQFMCDEAAAEAKAHVATCEGCAREVAAMRAAFSAQSALAAGATVRTDGAWRAQRLAISARIERAPGPRAAFHWTLAFASLLLAAVLMNQPVTQAPVEIARTADADHVLLVQIEQATRRSVPSALAPAELLVSELNSAVKQQANP